ncbi:hypothetical protein N8667_05055 [Verrucomicrobia bacterium]|nr:hypothetical protein [Verrucomicrobiota bacterium]
MSEENTKPKLVEISSYELKLEYLQLPNSLIYKMQKNRVETVQDLRNNLDVLNRLATSSKNLENFLSCCSEERFDFYSYLKKCNVFCQFFFWCEEFDQQCEKRPGTLINRSNFGVASIWLNKNQISTISELRDALLKGNKEPIGLGKSKYSLIFKGIKEFCENNPNIKQDSHSGVYEGHSPVNYKNPKLNSLNSIALGTSVSDLFLGVKASILKNNGIYTLKDLIESFEKKIFDIPYIGESSISKFSVALDEIGQCILEDGSIDYDEYSQLSGGLSKTRSSDTVEFYYNPKLSRLNEISLKTPIVNLHLGQKCYKLQKNEYKTLEELLEGLKGDIIKIRSIGKKSISNFAKSLDAIGCSIKEDGSIDFELFAERMGFPFLPTTVSEPNSQEFLDSIPLVIEEIAETITHEVDKLIYEERIVKGYRSKVTLEKLGACTGKTRERIRQLEKQLLASISDAIFFDEYIKLNFRFRPSFCEYFKKAAEAFHGLKTVTNDNFVNTIAKIWGVEPKDIMPHFVFISVVLTGTAAIPKAIRRPTGLSLAYYEEIPDFVKTIPIKELPVGKCYTNLLDEGVYTFLDCVEYYKLFHEDIGPKERCVLTELFKAVEEASKSFDRTLDFTEHLARHQNRPVIHVDPNLSTWHQGFVALIRTVVKHNQGWKHELGIFDKRISQPANSRHTLYKLGRELGTVGPTIKRTETKLTQELNDQLVEGELYGSNVYLSKEFRELWARFKAIYDDSDAEFPKFKTRLASEFIPDNEESERLVNTVWAILNIYPHGRTRERRTRERRTRRGAGTASSSGVIKLRGFRRVC